MIEYFTLLYFTLHLVFTITRHSLQIHGQRCSTVILIVVVTAQNIGSPSIMTRLKMAITKHLIVYSLSELCLTNTQHSLELHTPRCFTVLLLPDKIFNNTN